MVLLVVIILAISIFLFGYLSQQKNELEEDKQRLDRKVNDLEKKCKNYEKQITDYKTVSANNTYKIRETDAENSRLKKENATIQARLEKLNTTLSEKSESIKQLKAQFAEEVKGYKDVIKTLKSENNKIEKDYNSLNKNSEKLLKEKQLLEENQKNSQNEIAELQRQIEGLKSNEPENDEAQDEIENLKLQLEDIKNKYNIECQEKVQYKGEISNLQTTIEQLHNENDSKQQIIIELNQQIQELQPKETEFQSENPPIKEIENGGSIIIEPQPIPPKPDPTKRTIDTVIDVELNEEIAASQFFSQPEINIFKMRTVLERAIYLKKPKYVCKYCGQMVKISGRKYERGMARFFSHLRDSDDCDYKTTTGLTKREIEREKYARCNESERHKFLKAEISKYLERTSGVTDVKVESTVMGNHPILKWRRPDVSAKYRGQDIVFELQLSTTFVSVITERDLFYRLNKTHIIWIFSFDENSQYLDSSNTMTKDILYNSRLNIFVFDSEAQQKSEEAGELVLKCNWKKPDDSWEYTNASSDRLGGKFVRLSDLNFDDTYKPYYFDAETEYYKAHPEIKTEKINIEEENKKVIEELDKLWKQEKPKQSIFDEYGIDIEKGTNKYIVGKRDDYSGLITTEDRQIRMPFIYDEIKTHQGWYEGIRDGETDYYDKNFNLVNENVIQIEKLDDSATKYVKEVGEYRLSGIMDNKGVPLTQPIYSQIDVWCEGKYRAEHDGLWCIIDTKGNELIGGYDSISNLNAENVAEVKKGNAFGHIDSNCQAIKTDGIKLSNGCIKVCQLGKWGIEQSDGTMLTPCEYDEVGVWCGQIVGLTGSDFVLSDAEFDAECSVRVKYVEIGEKKKLVFKVGERKAFMNLRQQQKALKKGLKPKKLEEMYISCVNQERNLLYLSAFPVKPKPVNPNQTD